MVDESTSTEPWRNPKQGSQDNSKSSHEHPMEPGEHSVFSHFPKDPKLRYLLEDENNKGFLQKSYWYSYFPRAEHCGDLITADHKVHSKESESRNNYRYAVVVQDLATQWIQSYPCKTKSSQETQKNLMKFLEPTRTPIVMYTDNSLEFGKSCEELSWSHCPSTPHRSETNGIAEKSSAESEGRDICGAIADQSG